MKEPAEGLAELEIQAAAAANLRAILNTVVDAIVTIDEQGEIRMANQATSRMFGFDHEDLIGQNIGILMPAPYQLEHDEYVRRYVKTGEAQIIGKGREVTARKKDGTLFPIDLAVSELRLENGRMFTGVMRDMTDRRRTEEQLEHERTFSDSLLKTANAIVVVLDEQGRIFRVNDYMEHISGYRSDELYGLDWVTSFIPAREQESIRQLFQKTLGGTPVHSHVNSILTRSGEERQIAWSARRLTNADDVGNGLLAIGSDITELKSTERKLIQNERLAAIGQMMTGLAHESRNALQRTRACLEMLQLDLEDRPDLTDLTRRAGQALDELQRLYEEVRNYAAPLTLELSTCNLADLWSETWEHLNPSRTERRVRFRTNCDVTSLECRCDRNRMYQVLRNILENALAATPEGGDIALDCRDTEINGGSALEIRISDQGSGLTPEQRAKIFEPFYTTKTKGTGLGMAIAKRIIDAHSGTIQAVDRSGPGAEIVITLPC